MTNTFGSRLDHSQVVRPDTLNRATERQRKSYTSKSDNYLDKMEKAEHSKSEAKKLIKAANLERKQEKQQGPQAVFADVAQMKAKVKEAVMKPEYDVRNYYK